MVSAPRVSSSLARTATFLLLSGLTLWEEHHDLPGLSLVAALHLQARRPVSSFLKPVSGAGHKDPDDDEDDHSDEDTTRSYESAHIDKEALRIWGPPTKKEFDEERKKLREEMERSSWPWGYVLESFDDWKTKRIHDLEEQTRKIRKKQQEAKQRALLAEEYRKVDRKMGRMRERGYDFGEVFEGSNQNGPGATGYVADAMLKPARDRLENALWTPIKQVACTGCRKTIWLGGLASYASKEMAREGCICADKCRDCMLGTARRACRNCNRGCEALVQEGVPFACCFCLEVGLKAGQVGIEMGKQCLCGRVLMKNYDKSARWCF